MSFFHFIFLATDFCCFYKSLVLQWIWHFLRPGSSWEFETHYSPARVDKRQPLGWLPGFVNNVFLEPSHTHAFMYYPGLLFLYSGRIEPLWPTLHGSQSLKYSLCALTGKLGRVLLYSVSFSSPAGLSSPVLTCLLTYFPLTSFTPLSHFSLPSSVS